MFQRFVLRFNEFWVRIRKPRARKENLLLLLPHCLHLADCTRDVEKSIDECVHCGRCNIDDLVSIRDEFGIDCVIVSGGRQAVACVRQSKVKVVVAVACPKELADGILAAWPTPVVGVPNAQTNGPCRDTRVDPEAVRTAIRSVLISD